MSAASPSVAPSNRPDPTPDPAQANAPAATRNGRLLGLLRKLVNYGNQLLNTLLQRPAVETLVMLVLPFGTRNLAVIVKRIARALLIAHALEDRLVRRPLPEIAWTGRVRSPAASKPRGPRKAAPRSELADMPTAEEIADALRDRPVGEVIAQICRDLGIVMENPLWREIMAVVLEFHGNATKLTKDIVQRLCDWLLDPGWLTPGGLAAMDAQARRLAAARPP
jgi:hypothetical protein